MIERKLLEQIVKDQFISKIPQDYVPRNIKYDVSSLMEIQQVIVIAGIRRCGKSTLMQYIRSQSKEQNYYFNFDDDRLANFGLEDFQTLYEIFLELYGEQKTFFFDEIQNIPEWERFIRRLHDNGLKIYITGSNASMFSQELGTRLTGRYIQITLYPFSFKEYVFTKLGKVSDLEKLTSIQKAQIKRIFNEYYQNGGLPEHILGQQADYLHFLYESILYRDIIVRHKIGNEKALKQLCIYLASNVGKELTYNALKKGLDIKSTTTVSDYCEYLENSFLCFFINHYDYSLKKQMLRAKKQYFIDTALALHLGFRFSNDHGRLLENIVFLELKRRQKNIYFHKSKKECDFVIKNGLNITEAIQVCLSLKNDETREREIAGLLDALKNYNLENGLILTEDESEQFEITEDSKTYQVTVQSIAEWLLQE